MKNIKPILSVLEDYKNKGKLLSKMEVQVIFEALKAISSHKKIMTSLILFFSNVNENGSTPLNTLTQRERQVLYNIGVGKKSSEIADILNLSKSTIESHRKNIRKKLHLVGGGHLIEYAILNNLQQKTSTIKNLKK